MDPKRKRIYIIIIAICLVLAAVVLLWGRSGTPSVPVILNTSVNPVLPTGTTSGTPAPANYVDPAAPYTPPAVFPQRPNIDSSVLTSPQYKTLQDYQPVELAPGDLGRDNPFNNY